MTDGEEALRAFPKGRASNIPATKKEFEALLRSLGFSRSRAKAITSRGFTEDT